MSGQLLDAVAALEQEAALITAEAREDAEQIVASAHSRARDLLNQTNQAIVDSQEEKDSDLRQSLSGEQALSRDQAELRAEAAIESASRHIDEAVKVLVERMLDPHGYR